MVEETRFSTKGREGWEALSEAGSAGIVAGQFGFCPMNEPCSTAHNVRESDGHPARGYVGGGSTEQDSYEPRPAGWEGAKRLTARRLSVFSFDGSTAIFFLPMQKENGGGLPPGIPGTLRLVKRVSPGRRGRRPYGVQGGEGPAGHKK